ncbi:MAG: VOC family protein, partial [Acetobacteraceae bacterium]
MSAAPPRPPPLGHVLETSLYVDDMAASAAFYQRLFGFEKFFADARMCALGVGRRQVLLLFGKANGGTESVTPGGVIPAHGGSGHLH